VVYFKRMPQRGSGIAATSDGSSGSSEDAALLERASHGDIVAYEALVRMHQELAFRTAYLITRSAPDAEDVAQEAFVKAYRALPRARPGAPFRPWLLRIVANQARNRVRWRERRREVRGIGAPVERLDDGGGEPGRPDPVDPRGTPEDAVIALERRETLLAAVSRLGDDDRLVIGYRYLLELSEAETADVLAVPRGTVKSRLSRALGRLRAHLEATS
jgi:RNA polymerase sigma-70 factor (ECF subfamily)